MSSSTPDPAVAALLTLLDRADSLPAAAALRSRSYDLLDLSPGARVVDVGCGGGRAVAELAKSGARATGIDPSEQVIAAARTRWPELPFVIGAAEDLPFEDGSIDGYRADKVFHELSDPAEALAEARRVLAPGARIVLVDQD